MELNAKRQAADEGVDVIDPLPPSATGNRDGAQEPINAVAWQDYNEVCLIIILKPLGSLPLCSIPGVLQLLKRIYDFLSQQT